MLSQTNDKIRQSRVMLKGSLKHLRYYVVHRDNVNNICTICTK